MIRLSMTLRRLIKIASIHYLEAAIEKSEMDKGSRYELRFRCQKLEFIATGGTYQRKQDGTKLDAFLGVAVPSFICQDTEFLASSKKWSFKSQVFQAMNFCTSDQLRLFEEETNGFTSVCSKIISLVIDGALTMKEIDKLESKMTDFQYYKSIGLNEVPSKDVVLDQIDKIKKKNISIRFSKPKLLIIDIIFSRRINVSNRDLLLLYNEIIYPKIKNNNLHDLSINIKFD
ncbi:uncharacterized protein EV154DRAFT_555739 [Mucor mucedo]|uniref:uncharacterized protein n=1 Tax=Mucor mucedo TaxID=29922 RepID=UPI002220D975|nr:uncharacterized protein EV154DRAFT_555739 [Mucor mucedo]KAI7876295.1 hypothetical protein EV154DRAFT_555739 [Mucor mucedo]